MANNGNLQSFEKGQSGNPNGRPKGSRNVSTILAGMLDDLAPDTVVEKSFLREIAKNIKKPTFAHAAAARLMWEGIVNGESWALREVLDRTEGKAKQAIEITRENDSNGLVLVLQNWIANRNPSQDKIDEAVLRVADANGIDPTELASKVFVND